MKKVRNSLTWFSQRWETSAGQARSRLVCHVLVQNLCFSFRLQFVSRAGINHIAVHWQYKEILLFTGLLDTNEFRSPIALEHHRKNVQLGLRIGQAAPTGNLFWKFVVPTVSYFVWLPECLARAFCAESLATFQAGQYTDPTLCHADLECMKGL